jgi:hypothetical protein
MPEHSNRFNDRFLRRRLQENDPKLSFDVKDSSRAEPQYTTMYKGVMFLVGRGHAYRDHETGPSTNPRFGGPAEIVESAIIEDAFKRRKKGMLKATVKIAAGGPGIIFRHIPIRYNALEVDGTIHISDYMVWQGTVEDGQTWEKCISQDWLRYG